MLLNPTMGFASMMSRGTLVHAHMEQSTMLMNQGFSRSKCKSRTQTRAVATGITSDEAFRLTEKTASPATKAKRTISSAWKRVKAVTRLLSGGRPGRTTPSATNHAPILPSLREKVMDGIEAQICCSVDEWVESASSSVFAVDGATTSTMDGYEADDDRCLAVDSSLDESFEVVADPDMEQMNKAQELFTPTTDYFQILQKELASDRDVADADADDEASLDSHEDDHLWNESSDYGLSIIEEE